VASPFVEILVDTPTGERLVKVTNPDRTYFSGLPEGKGRKIDLVEYYLAVGPGIVRALNERSTVLKRHPAGAESEAIYTKRVPKGAPPWIQTATVEFPSGRSATELCPVDVAHVVWAVQMSTLDFHPWPSRRAHLENPDELRIDLDPMPGTDWDDVVEVALEVKALFDELGIISFPKTSGSKGVHVYVRCKPAYTFTEVRHCAVAIAWTTTGWRGTRRSPRRTPSALAHRRPSARPSPGTSCPTARSATSTSGRCGRASPHGGMCTAPSTTCSTT
jgi:DNA ligase D-like protein (predicted polymerase)